MPSTNNRQLLEVCAAGIDWLVEVVLVYRWVRGRYQDEHTGLLECIQRLPASYCRHLSNSIDFLTPFLSTACQRLPEGDRLIPLGSLAYLLPSRVFTYESGHTRGPYRNSDLFAGYYLDEWVADLDDWECDDEAKQAFDELQTLWEAEGDLLPSYNEDELLGAWIDEGLEILGFDTLQETTLPDSGGYNDRLLFESADAQRDAARSPRLLL